MIDIVHYSPSYETAHYQFASQYWSKRKRIVSEYIYWKFRGKLGKDLNSFILAIEKERVIGQLGLIPCSIKVKDKIVEAQWACDLMVDTNYRGKGIAKLLYEYAFKLKPITLGSDPSPAAATSMKRAGFVSLKGSLKFMFPMYIGEITKLKGYNSKLLDKIPNPFILILWVWKIIRGNKKFRLMNTADYIEKLNFCLQQSEESINAIYDESFVNWRFKPFKDYYTEIKVYSDEANSTYSIYKDKSLHIITQYSANSIPLYLDIFSSTVLEAKK